MTSERDTRGERIEESGGDYGEMCATKQKARGENATTTIQRKTKAKAAVEVATVAVLISYGPLSFTSRGRGREGGGLKDEDEAAKIKYKSLVSSCPVGGDLEEI